MKLASSQPQASLSEETVTTIEKSVAKRRILVIDENAEIRNSLGHQLNALGFEVAIEDNGVSGLSRIAYGWESAPFHGLFLELDMKVLGGMAVLQEVVDRFPSVTVIVMSDAKNIGRLRRAMKLGAKEYLVKPFDPELVRRKCLSVFFERKGLES